MNTGSIGIQRIRGRDVLAADTGRAGQHVLVLGAEDDLGVLGHVAAGAVDGADYVLRRRGPRPEELADGAAVERLDVAGLAGDAGQHPARLSASEAGVDPAHRRRVGRRLASVSRGLIRGG